MMVSDIYGFATLIWIPALLLYFLLTVYHLLAFQYHSVSELALNIMRQQCLSLFRLAHAHTYAQG